MTVSNNDSIHSGGSDGDDSGLVEKYCANMDNDFKRLFSQALRYIDINAPTLISAGSSGSYFIRGEENKILAIFKPEDEEPYGLNNPKWMKWFQKVCCKLITLALALTQHFSGPCTFGRGCLVPNQVCLHIFIQYLFSGLCFGSRCLYRR
jgi:hypothetical protein